MRTPEVITDLLSALIDSSSSTSTRALLNDVLNNFLAMLLRSARPNTGQLLLESSELSITVERVAKETLVDTENYKISTAARELFVNGIVVS